ncbi:hypothetical protein HUJ05_000505 [Dendroctonus ponderosae]|nr:hypothetical protein HUJ05_000505 [Dendroctonus ponderosae]
MQPPYIHIKIICAKSHRTLSFKLFNCFSSKLESSSGHPYWIQQRKAGAINLPSRVQEFSKLGGSSAYDLVQRQKQAFRAPPKRLKTPSKIGLEERLIDKIQKNKFKYI